MKARVITKVSIAAAPPAVFEYLADTKYHHLWNPHLRRLEPLTRLAAGTEYRTYNIVLGVRTKATNLVAKLVPDRELEIRNMTGMLEYSVNYRLEAQAGGTLLTCRTVVSTDSKAFAFARPMLELLARRELLADLEALKLAVEQGKQ